MYIYSKLKLEKVQIIENKRYIFALKTKFRNRMKKIFILALVAVATGFTACKETKKTDDIIVKKVEKKEPAAPVRMQEYNQTAEADLAGSHLTCVIHRQADDSLAMVKDETGQQFYDNRISLNITRGDGTTFFSRTFTKADFNSCLDDDYRATGILEGLVFDRVDGSTLRFAASVSHPGTDEYIPIVISIDRFAAVSISLDTRLDTSSEEEEE